MPHPSRRGFLRTGLAAGTFLALPAAVYRGAFAADDRPSERVRVGCIGVGNQGKGNMGAFLKRARVTAVCEVDATRLATAADTVEKAGGKPLAVGDYRKLVESNEVDAVCITTPDHWHALQAIHACEAGKDVYVEKPLTLTVAEGRAMVAAARKHNRIVQTGSQQRSDARFRQACELVRNGYLGKIKTVTVGLPKPNWTDRAKTPVPDSEVPKELDFETWLGPAPLVKYNANKVHYLFRFFWDYSGGQQTNFGAHHLDITQWALGMDESGPTAVEGTAKYHPKGWYETPDWTSITYTYPDGVTVRCGQDHKGGCLFEGEKGAIFVDRGRIEITVGGEKQDPAKVGGGEIKLYASDNHHQNFLDCVKSRKLPVADVEIGHRSATVCHLGNIAVRTGRKIAWDAAKETIVGDADAAKMLTKEYRKPWKLG
jgi:predicted dehydrogenase